MPKCVHWELTVPIQLTPKTDSLLLGVPRYYYSLFASYYRLPEILMSIVG